MAALDTLMRVISSRTMTVNSSGGASASTTAFGSQTYAVDLAHPHSTASVRFVIYDASAAQSASSTASALIPPFCVNRYKVTPGQLLAAIGDGAATTLTIVELSK